MGGWRGLIVGAGLLAAAIPVSRAAGPTSRTTVPASRAAGPAVPAKPGLWQVTMTTRISGEHFSSPGPKTAVVQQCHTWHKFAFQDVDPGSCKKPVIVRTRMTVDMHLECSGEERSSHLRITAPDKFTATSEILWGVLRQETSYQGKWLGRNCMGLRPLD